MVATAGRAAEALLCVDVTVVGAVVVVAIVALEMLVTFEVGADVVLAVLLGLEDVDGLISLLTWTTSLRTIAGMLSCGSALHSGDIEVVNAVSHPLGPVWLARASGSGLTVSPLLVIFV